MSNVCILGVILVFKYLMKFGSYGSVGAIALMQLQEDLKKHLSAECHYTEEQLEAYMETHKTVMVDSLWKLNVADIEATLSHVCQMVCSHVLATFPSSVIYVFPFILKFIDHIRYFKIAVPERRNCEFELKD
jgi:hypothetical protein